MTCMFARMHVPAHSRSVDVCRTMLSAFSAAGNRQLSAMQPSIGSCLMPSVSPRKAYIKSWFLLDIVACLPLECILANAAKTVNFYNTPKLIRSGSSFLFVSQKATCSSFREGT